MTDTNLDRAAKMATRLRAHAAQIYHEVHQSQLWADLIGAAEAIEQHEAFKLEVSDAVEHYRSRWPANARRDIFDAQFGSFILPKPDPLVEVLKEADAPSLGDDGYEAMADRVHAALAKHGLKLERID